MEKGFRVGVAIVVITVVLVGALGFRVAVWSSFPQVYRLPLEAGTVSALRGFLVAFTVVGANAQLVGTWYGAAGGVLIVAPTNFTGEFMLPCFMGRPWNGTINASLTPGNYSMALRPMGPEPIEITQTVRLTYPATGNASSFYFDGSPC